jgi:hypothetical protein
MKRVVMLLVIAGLAAAEPAAAVDPRHPDWPCVQVKVPELSVASIWAGPPIDDIGSIWEQDPQLRDLVARLAARRVPLEEAEKAAADFVNGDAKTKEDKARRLFGGVFDALNRQRSEVMNGIERLARRQREMAEKIRREAQELRSLQDAAGTDAAKLEQLANQLQWDTRIFEDQRKTVSYVCEVPVIIERRLGALARAIQQSLD